MANIFNYDSPIIAAINKIADMVILSILYLILCIPIVTIGPATTALYYTIVKNIRKERSYTYKEFFKSFKSNFKQGFSVTLIFLVMYFVLYIDIKFAQTLTGTQQSIFIGIFLGILIIVIAVNLYIFPYLSRFEVKIKQLFKNSFYLALKHFPSTILMNLILLASIYLIYISPFAIIIAPSLVILLQSYLMERIFKKYMPNNSNDQDGQVTDEWYLD
ncbi:MAG: YesL family protein [Bacillota bacterium]|nr:YesL family protein [Bacillota bacterium]